MAGAGRVAIYEPTGNASEEFTWTPVGGRKFVVSNVQPDPEYQGERPTIRNGQAAEQYTDAVVWARQT
ncbi:hypothetical protein [Actinomadura sp. 6N118]|uniref:hypothetical protein n=1 Tax=Actinomadura sp. 6N118 TaxID=3375151 RepID=UPI0037B23B11